MFLIGVHFLKIAFLMCDFQEKEWLNHDLCRSDSKGGQFLIWFNRTFTLVYVEDFR
jgi:hypothetical protein